jgi:hypothetical protein
VTERFQRLMEAYDFAEKWEAEQRAARARASQ